MKKELLNEEKKTVVSTEQKTLEELMSEAQQYMSRNYISLLADEERKPQLKVYLAKFLRDHDYSYPGMTGEELVDTLYSDMAEYSVLTEYFGRADVEEINVNGWDDIAITYTDGRTEKTARHFYSPSHATDVVKRLLHHSGMIIDNAAPIAQGHLPGNTRITAIKDPVVDKDRGIAVSIRIIQMKKLDRKAMIESGFATEEMISFLEMCLRYGISTVIAGRTSSGKTTLLNILLEAIPDTKRIYTIESGAREMDLVRRDPAGNVLNNVVHTLSRPSENQSSDISQEDLVVSALRFNPDVVCVGEMRDSEANAAVEASFTGHTLISTVHSGPGESAHMRIALLCQRRFAIDFDLSLMQAGQAFPVVVFAHKLEDNSRRIMDITECVVARDGSREYKPLYRYVITRNERVDGKPHIEGHFEKVNTMSESLQNKLLQYGMPKEEMERFTEI